ncbi:MAG TPA: hypothetical protein VJ873_11315, partial [bacterium]|nr:hypothetical protein [bacterium]
WSGLPDDQACFYFVIARRPGFMGRGGDPYRSKKGRLWNGLDCFVTSKTEVLRNDDLYPNMRHDFCG